MSDENTPLSDEVSESWEAPPPPQTGDDEKEQPQMSEVASLANIFFEPGKTFEDMRRKPRFILASLIIIVLVSAFSILTIQKVGFENIAKAQIEASPFTRDMSQEQKEAAIKQQTSSVAKGISYAATPIVFVIIFLLGALIYWLGSSAFGGSAGFLHGLSVWVYSSLPPTILFVIANLLILFLKAADDIDPIQAQKGLFQANPGMFMDGKEMPVLTAFLSNFDLLAIWGYILAAIGLKIVAKLSMGSAIAVVLILALVKVTATVVGAMLF